MKLADRFLMKENLHILLKVRLRHVPIVESPYTCRGTSLDYTLLASLGTIGRRSREARLVRLELPGHFVQVKVARILFVAMPEGY